MTHAEAKRYAHDPSAAQRDALRVLEKAAAEKLARRSRSRTPPPRQAFDKPDRRERLSQEKKAERKVLAKRRRVYAAVDARSAHVCEFLGMLGRCENRATEHDHFWGRGKVQESVENVWHLCDGHHRIKTRNEPSRALWIERYRSHCAGHRYAAEVAKCDRALALEAAQHPGRAAHPEALKSAGKETR